jgi:hypothetical protein
MTTVTGDDIRVLARSRDEQPVLVLLGGEVAVVPAADADPETIVYTRADLIDEFGDQVPDIEIDILASALTARLSGDTA